MNSEYFEKGLGIRKDVLGAQYVDAQLHAADDFNRDFQEMVTAYCWGFGWGDETLDKKQRSMINLSMIAALNRMHEWELHFRGAIKNGLTRQELKAILHQIAIYAGIPVGVECFRIAKKVFAEIDAAEA
ncbi:MAG: carboxymuconolactone decarboxylase family protein [Arenicellales bacterium WSBS_2016_MAG_OTU3]